MVSALIALVVVNGCRLDLRRPNVLLISIDCLNGRQLEEAIAQGNAPHVKQLAGDSLVFRRAYAHAPWTTPAHNSMLTGLYPSQHGQDVPITVGVFLGRLGERVPTYETLADHLAAAGYETVAFVGKGNTSAHYGLAKGFAGYHESAQVGPTRSDLVASEEAVRRWYGSRSERPFFLFLHTFDLHYPLPKSRASSAAAIQYIDAFVGRLLSLLRDSGQYDSTLVILTGDHGSEMTSAEGKCCVHGAGHYEENLRVPLLMKLPAPGPSGLRDGLARHVDLLPTVLDVVGLPGRTYRGPGTSLLARLDRTSDEFVSFSEADARCASRQAVVTRRYKYIYTPQDPLQQLLSSTRLFYDSLCERQPACKRVPVEELYDLENDPLERQNLLEGPLAPEANRALAYLRVALEQHRNLPRAYRLTLVTEGDQDRAGRTRHDESVKEALRALGYGGP